MNPKDLPRPTLNSANLPQYAAALFVLFAFIFLGFKLATEPTTISNVHHASVTPTSSTIAWTTPASSHGCVWQFSLLPKRICHDYPASNTHLVKLDGLKPQKNYTFLIQSGFNFKYVKRQPVEIPETAPGLPNPTYGQVLFPDGNPAAYALLLIDTNKGKVATITDKNGRYHADLYGSYPKNSWLNLNIFSGNTQFAHYRIVIGYHQPNPDFLLDTKHVLFE